MTPQQENVTPVTPLIPALLASLEAATLPSTPTEAPITTEQIPTVKLDYTKPLPSELVTVLKNELDALVAKPINGWDQQYPTLYRTLLDITTQLCAEVNCPVPGLVVQCTGINANQGLAMIMQDGSTQLHIGAAFISSFLLDSATENALQRHRIFRWTIAHELGHLCDSTMHWWASKGKIRDGIVSITDMLISYGIFDGVFAHIPALTRFSGGNYQFYIILGLGLKIAYKTTEIILHRNFEYFADAVSVKTAEQFSAHEIEQGLTSMTTAIKKCLAAEQKTAREALVATSKTSALGTLMLPILLVMQAYKNKVAQFNLFLLHPSVASRLAAIKKHVM